MCVIELKETKVCVFMVMEEHVCHIDVCLYFGQHTQYLFIDQLNKYGLSSDLDRFYETHPLYYPADYCPGCQCNITQG